MPSPRAALVAALAGAAAVTGGARAEAQQPEPVRLSWVRGPGADACAGQRQIADQVTARLGRSPFAADAAREIDVYVTADSAGWRVGLYVRDRDGKRLGTRALTSEAADCAAVEAATVLAIALAIDPDAGTRPPPPAPSPPLPPPVSSPPLPAPERPRLLVLPAPLPPPVAPSPVTPLDGGLLSGASVRAGAGLGLLPRPAFGLGLAAHVGLTPIVELTAEALWMPEVHAADARFAFGLSAFALGACFSVVRREVADLAACGALWGGALHAVVSGLEPTDPGDRAWASASATPRLRLRLASRLHLELGAHLLVPVIRQPFTVSGFKDPVFQQTPVALLPFAALGTNFP